MLAKFVLNKHRYSSTTKALQTLHWLPIRARILHKLLNFVHKCLHGNAPAYLKDLIQVNISTRNLRSTLDTTLLRVPSVKSKTFASRSFAVAGPTKWNTLPRYLREIMNFDSFKAKLKMHLLKQYLC